MLAFCLLVFCSILFYMRWEDLKSLLVLLIIFFLHLVFIFRVYIYLISPLHLSSSTNPAATSQGPPTSVKFPLNFPLQSSCIIHGPCHTIKQILVQYGIMEPSSLMVEIMQSKPWHKDFMLPLHFTCIVIVLRARLWIGFWSFTDVTTVHNTYSVSTCWWLSTYMLEFLNLILI